VSTDEDPRHRQIIDAIANGLPGDGTARQDVSDPGANGSDKLSALQAIAAIAEFHRGHNPDVSAASLGDVLNAADARFPDLRLQPDLSKGESWGPLIVLERIDGGSFGDVFRAWDPALAKVVALKRSRYSSAADAARAALEARRLANIPPHPNVITVHGACNINGVVGIWMEFLRGRTLQRLVNDEAELGWVEATHYGECLCRALSHIHGAQLLHRDLKAANVMKAAGGRIVLIDFGSGGEIAPLGAREPDRLVGTLPYMAPELFEGKPATQQTDIYSLGVLLFNLVTGSYPVSGNTREDFETAHKHGRRILLSDVRSDLPMPFVRVVERAMAPNLEQRYRTAGEFLLELVPSAVAPLVAPEHIAKSGRVDRTRTVLRSALGVGSAVMGLGVVNSRFFNLALGRSDFVNEYPWTWLYWGARSIVAPAFLSLVALLGIALCRECGRLLVAGSPRARALAQRTGRAVHRFRLDDVSTLGSCALLGSSLALLGAWWYFTYREPTIGKLIAATSPDISTVSAKSLAFLSPRFRDDHELYRETFIAVSIFCAMLWYPAIRLATQKGQIMNQGLLAGGAAVLLLSLLLLDFPYRLLASWESRTLEEVKWHGASCFILGERQIDLLLFCPETPPPRNRIVHKNDPDLEDTHEVKDIFMNVDELE
jgi:hypothetical protein